MATHPINPVSLPISDQPLRTLPVIRILHRARLRLEAILLEKLQDLPAPLLVPSVLVHDLSTISSRCLHHLLERIERIPVLQIEPPKTILDAVVGEVELAFEHGDELLQHLAVVVRVRANILEEVLRHLVVNTKLVCGLVLLRNAHGLAAVYFCHLEAV